MFQAFPNKRLCDLVFPGTHDAGVYGNELGGTARTQNLTLGEQAEAGVRYFDLRIATVKTDTGLEKRAYHAPKLQTKTKGGERYQKPVLFKAGKLGAGLGLTGVGSERLSVMLDQARQFVLNSGEFLVLRFSKCGNMEEVVQQCLLKLGTERFDQNVNLNTQTVNQLQGTVITVFDQKDFNALPHELKMFPGILPVRALFGAGDNGGNATYDPHMWGLQYFGKYSNTRNVRKNLRKQAANLAQGPVSSPELLGMMYWTLTTKVGEGPNPFESIENRDGRMWRSHRHDLVRAWKAGVKDHIIARAGHQHRQWLANGYPAAGIGRSAKSFMPNIVMLDFADPNRCATIWNLNLTTADTIAQMGDDLTNVGQIM